MLRGGLFVASLVGIDTPRLEGKLACQRCDSVVRQELDAELSARFPNIEKMNFSPVYFTQRIFVWNADLQS